MYVLICSLIKFSFFHKVYSIPPADTGAGYVPYNGWGLRPAAPLVEEPVNVPDHPDTVNGDHTVITQFCLPADIGKHCLTGLL